MGVRHTTLTRLFLRFRSRRDGRALAQLFDALAPELLGVATHLSSDPSQAEDLVQATFLVAIERADTFDANLSIKPWLYGILCREAASTRRRTARAIDPERLIPSSSIESSARESATLFEVPGEIHLNVPFSSRL